MASTVTNISNLIDTNFPRPGESLSSVEEFQSNFQKIQESFRLLSKESTEQITKNINTIQVNDFNQNIISRAMFENVSYSYNYLGVVSNGIVELNVRDGVYHKCLVNTGYYTFNITNWQNENIKSKIRLEILNASSSTTSTCQIGFSGKITYLGTQTEYINLERSDSIFYDLWTTDQGKNIIIEPIGKTMYSAISIPSGGGGGSGNPPIITNISPSVFSNISGETITITGNYFTTGTVYLGNATVSSPSVSLTSITFTNPGLPAGYLPIRVTTPNGTTSTFVIVVDNIDYGASGGGGGPSE